MVDITESYSCIPYFLSSEFVEVWPSEPNLSILVILCVYTVILIDNFFLLWIAFKFVLNIQEIL